VFGTDDPTEELSAAWGVKEQLRRLLKTATVEQARHHKMILGCYVLAADMEETWRLWQTVEAWWPAIEVLIEHRVSNARTEAAKTSIKQIERCLAHRNALHTANPYLFVTPVTKARKEPASSAYFTHLLGGCGITPQTVRCTRLADLVNSVDPKIVAAAFGMDPEGAMFYLADHVDPIRVEDPNP
jgi:hypothetical protein